MTTKDNADLLKKITEARNKIISTRLEIYAGKNKNTNAYKVHKKTLAQLLTLANNTK